MNDIVQARFLYLSSLTIKEKSYYVQFSAIKIAEDYCESPTAHKCVFMLCQVLELN